MRPAILALGFIVTVMALGTLSACGRSAPDVLRDIQLEEVKKQQARDDAFLAGTLSLDDWKDALERSEIERRTRWETAKRLGQIGDFESLTPEQKAIDRYYSLAVQYTDPNTGIFDIEGYSQATQQYLASLTPELQNSVEGRLDQWDTPLVKEFRAAQEGLRSYWSVGDELLQRADLELQDVYKIWENFKTQGNDLAARELMKYRPDLQAWDYARQGIQAAMRVYYPQVDKSLQKWYGRQPMVDMDYQMGVINRAYNLGIPLVSQYIKQIYEGRDPNWKEYNRMGEGALRNARMSVLEAVGSR
jgi:hypothetical protein